MQSSRRGSLILALVFPRIMSTKRNRNRRTEWRPNKAKRSAAPAAAPRASGTHPAKGLHVLRNVYRKLRERGFVGLIRTLRKPVLAALLIALGAAKALQVLPVSGAPTSPPPLVAAVTPDLALHTTNNGYIMAVTVTVTKCSSPVNVEADLVLPREFYKTEQPSGIGSPLTKALVGISVGDPRASFHAIHEGDWQSDPQHARDLTWITHFSTPTLVGATGTVATIRLDDWRSRPDEVVASFTADWLSPRGYGSCWLRLPRLMGEDVPNLAVNSADAVNEQVGRASGASNTGMSGGSSSRITWYLPAGKRVSRQSQPEVTQYVDGDVPASIGYTALASQLSIIPGESEGAAPELEPRAGSAPRPSTKPSMPR